MDRLAGKSQGLQIRYVLQAKWRISHSLGPPPGLANSLCFTSEFEGSRPLGAPPKVFKFARFYKRIGRFRPQARDSLNTTNSLCFISEMDDSVFGYQIHQNLGIRYVLQANLDVFHTLGAPRQFFKFAMFYKRIGRFPRLGSPGTWGPDGDEIRYVLQANWKVFSSSRPNTRTRNSLCFTSEFGASHLLGRAPKAANSLGFISEMVSSVFYGSHLPGCKFALFRNTFSCFSCGQPTYWGMQKRQVL